MSLRFGAEQSFPVHPGRGWGLRERWEVDGPYPWRLAVSVFEKYRQEFLYPVESRSCGKGFCLLLGGGAGHPF